MGVGGIIGMLVLVLVLGIPTMMIFVDNTKALNKEKELQARLKQLDRDVASMPDDASPEDVAALQGRATALGKEIDAWRRSPFVISKPPA